MNHRRKPWTDEERTVLRALWFDPEASLHRMMQRLGKSNSLIVNEAMRLGFPSRDTIRPRDAHKFKPKESTRPEPLPRGARTIPLLPSELAALQRKDAA